MAKSLRSKWKRKMRAIRRQRNAPKELDKLKKILSSSTIKDVVMSEENCQIKSMPIKPPVSKSKKSGQDEDLEMEVEKKKDKKTMMDENGQFPVWLNGRKIKKMRQKKKKGKVGKKKLLAW